MTQAPSPYFHAPHRVLLGPGPSNIHHRVLGALAQPAMALDDAELSRLWQENKSLLHAVLRTKNDLTFAFNGSGTAGMEASLTNLVEPGEKVIVAVNGLFGGRLLNIANRIGAQAIVVEDDWGKPVDPHKVEEALRAHPDTKALAFVHGETSTGVESDAATLCALAERFGVLSIVDAVTSLGGIPVESDAWHADAVFSATQKCLSCAPGLSPITFSRRALDVVRNRPHPVPSYYLEIGHLLEFMDKGSKGFNLHVNPMNGLYGLHQGLSLIVEEGLEAVWVRHRQAYRVLKAGVEALGLRYINDEAHRLPQLNALAIPDGIDGNQVRALVLERFNISLGFGIGQLANKIWRIGLMGQGANVRNALSAVVALDAVLAELGHSFPRGEAILRAEQAATQPDTAAEITGFAASPQAA